MLTSIGFLSYVLVAGASPNLASEASFPVANGIADETLLIDASLRQVQILRDPFGRPHTVLGEFPLQSQLGQSQDLVADALRGFLIDLSAGFGIQPELVSHLSLTHVVDIDDGQRAYFFKTFVEGVQVFDSEISILVDHELNSVLGVNSIALSLLDERLAQIDTKPLVLRGDIDAILDASDHETIARIRAIPIDDPIFDEGVYGDAILLPDAYQASLAWYESKGALFWRVPSMMGDILVDAMTGDVVIEEGGRDGNGSSVVGIRVYKYEPITSDVSDPWALDSAVGTEIKNLSVDWDSAGGSVRTYKLRRNYNIPYPLPQVLDDGTLTHTETILSLPEGLPVTFNSTMSTNDGSYFRQQHIYYWLRKARDFFDAQVFSFISPQYTWGVNYISMDRGSLSMCGLPTSDACYIDLLKRIEFVDDADSSPHPPRDVAHEYAHHVINMYGDQSDFCQKNVDEGWLVDEAFAEAFAHLIVGYTIGSAYGSAGYDVDRHAIGGHFFKRDATPSNCNNEPYPVIRYFTSAIIEISHNLNCSTASCYQNVGAPGRTTYGSQLGFSSQSEARYATARAMAHALKSLPMNTTLPATGLYVHAYFSSHYPAAANGVYAVLQHHQVLP